MSRKRAKFECIELAAAVQHAADTVMISYSAAASQSADPTFTSLTGYSSAETVGRNPRFLKSGQQSTSGYKNP
jgi:hypothetical protein